MHKTMQKNTHEKANSQRVDTGHETSNEARVKFKITTPLAQPSPTVSTASLDVSDDVEPNASFIIDNSFSSVKFFLKYEVL